MARLVFTPDQLAARIRADKAGLADEIRGGLRSAAQRGRGLVIADSPTDRGILRNAWKVVDQIDGVLLQNDQPYAGVVERGARPFRISPEGLAALEGWVFRKLLLGTTKKRRGKRAQLEAEAKKIAWAIAKKFEARGIQGKFFVKKILPQLAAIMDEEVMRYIQDFFNRPIGGLSGQ